MSKARKNFKKPKVVGSHHSVDLTEPVTPLFHSRGSESFCFSFHCRPITKRMIASLPCKFSGSQQLKQCTKRANSNLACSYWQKPSPSSPWWSDHLATVGYCLFPYYRSASTSFSSPHAREMHPSPYRPRFVSLGDHSGRRRSPTRRH